jgi:ribosomal protein S18 acetylase RimI-like enzyme
VLSGIAVEPALRGRGLGRAVTAELTRRAVARHGLCTLGMFSSNTVARRLYRRLGYRTGQAWATRVLADRAEVS